MDSEQRLACNFGQYSSNSGAASHQPISTSTRTERSERAGEGGSVPLLFSLFVPFSDQAVGVGRTRRKEIGSDPVHLCFEGYPIPLHLSEAKDTDPEFVPPPFPTSVSYLIRQLDVLLEGPDGRVGQLDEDDALLCTVLLFAARCSCRRRCRCRR